MCFFLIEWDVYTNYLDYRNSEASIRGTCFLLQGPGNPVQNIASVLSFFFEPDECMILDHEYIIESERQTEWNATAVEVGHRQWTYQMCSSIGWFHTSGAHPDHPFGSSFPVEVYHESCQAVFGESYVNCAIYTFQSQKFTIFVQKDLRHNDLTTILIDSTLYMLA